MSDGSTKKKVIIMGFAPSTRCDTPFDDESFEVWGLNDLYRCIPRADRWFEMHTREVIENHPYYGGKHLKELQDCQIPIYMQQVHPDIPHSMRYPIEQMTRYFFGDDIPEGTSDKDTLYYSYFTNTVSYMMALAIYEGYEEIHLYGVDMCADSEYSHQRPSVEYFIGFARGRGIKVRVPLKSDLLKTIYPYEYVDTHPLRRRMEARIEGHELEVQEFINQRNRLIAEQEAFLREFRERLAQLDGDINVLRGRQSEDRYYLKVWSPNMMLDDGPRKDIPVVRNSGRPEK